MAARMKISELEKIPNPELGTLAMFIIGIDCKKVLAAPTFQRHKKILQAYGFNIADQIKGQWIPATESLKISRAET